VQWLQTIAACGDFWLDLNFGSAFFQLLKFVMPGASFAKDFGVRLYFRATVAGLRLKDNAVALEFEIIGFVFVIRVFDKKIEAAAYGTFHMGL